MGISLIQTVDNSSDTSCLVADDSSRSSFFTLDPPVPSQCSNQTISWSSTVYKEPPSMRAFIPGGQAFDLPRPPINATRQSWEVDIQEGTQLLLLVQPADLDRNPSRVRDARTSPLITVTSKSSQGDACLDENSPSSTTTISSPTTTPRIPSTTTTSTMIVSTITTLITTVSGVTHPD